jgi:hypothetical protein
MTDGSQWAIHGLISSQASVFPAVGEGADSDSTESVRQARRW